MNFLAVSLGHERLIHVFPAYWAYSAGLVHCRAIRVRRVVTTAVSYNHTRNNTRIF